MRLKLLYQVQSGEAPTSARAITPVSLALHLINDLMEMPQEIMRRLNEYNQRSDISVVKKWLGSSSSTTNTQSHDGWGGGRTRKCLLALFTIAFVCLLRFDEVLKIQAHDIKVINSKCIQLSLPFRKTAQNGGL
jgi:hypothetical protein